MLEAVRGLGQRASGERRIGTSPGRPTPDATVSDAIPSPAPVYRPVHRASSAA